MITVRPTRNGGAAIALDSEGVAELFVSLSRAHAEGPAANLRDDLLRVLFSIQRKASVARAAENLKHNLPEKFDGITIAELIIIMLGDDDPDEEIDDGECPSSAWRF